MLLKKLNSYNKKCEKLLIGRYVFVSWKDENLPQHIHFLPTSYIPRKIGCWVLFQTSYQLTKFRHQYRWPLQEECILSSVIVSPPNWNWLPINKANIHCKYSSNRDKSSFKFLYNIHVYKLYGWFLLLWACLHDGR